MKCIVPLFFVLVFSAIIPCCNDVSGPDSKPSLSNLTIPENLTLACYPFQSRLSTRNDSMTISFDYNSKKISAFSIEGTIDSGKSWFVITQQTVTPVNDHEDFIWSPKDDSSETFEFCDEKICMVRVTAPTDTLTSKEFYLIGFEPGQLIQPMKGNLFTITDSLPVEFNANSDLLSDIDVSFYTDDAENRVQFSEDSSRSIITEGINTNVKKYIYYFPLIRYADKLTENSSVVSIMISDYQQSGFFQIVDSIIIVKP